MEFVTSALPGTIDPAAVPQRTLRGGISIPCIGFGTFSAARSSAEVADAVKTALQVGYRLLDCAAAYNNEDDIGKIIADASKSGIARHSLFILSKLPNSMHGSTRVQEACRKTLEDLRVDYLDAYLVHWPVPNTLSPPAEKGVFNDDSRPYVHEEFMATWRGMEKLVKQGLVRSIGISNVTVGKLRLILRDAAIAPAINEMEIHPTFRQEELFDFSLKNDILPVAYSPIGSPLRPQRNRMPGDLVDTQDPVVIRIAEKHNMSPAALCVHWAVQRGQVPVPFSTDALNMVANLQAALKSSLSARDMEDMKSVDRGCRLSRGLAYLWPGASSWHEMWDEAVPLDQPQTP